MSSQTTSWIEKTATAVDATSDRLRIEQSIQQLTEHREALTRVVKGLTALNDALDLTADTRSRGVSVPATIWTSLRKSQKTLDHRSLFALERDLDILVRDTGREEAKAWVAEVRHHMSDLENWRGLAATLPAANAIGGMRRELDELLTGLRRAVKDEPSADAINLLARSKAIRERISQHLPLRIREFMLAASSSGGASVESLDAEVLAWMKDAGVMGAFRVVTRSEGTNA